MKAAIEKIIIMERIRKEVGRITELAEDIEKNGLLNPVTIMSLENGEFKLLAGLRRIKAAQKLGWTEIEVNIVSPSDAEAALRIKFSENEQREQFTFSEKMDYGKLIEVIEQAKASERQAEGQSRGGATAGNGRNKEESCLWDTRPTSNNSSPKRVRDIVGEKIDMSGRQYDRAKYVADKASPEVIEQIDKGERTIYEVFKEVHKKESAVESSEADNSSEPEVNSVQHSATKPDTIEQIDDSSSEESKPETKTQPKPRSETPNIKLPSETRAAKNDPFFQKLKAEEAEAIRKREEFDALPPEGKITELQRQIKELRARAVTAESDLETLKLNYGISIDHKDSIIESLKRQNAELNAELTAANTKIAELGIN